MNRKAEVWLHDKKAGLLKETDSGYDFSYSTEYQNLANAMSVSKTLPVKKSSYQSNVLFPFFDGLIPEGWLLDIAVDNWKVNERDRFGLLLACCRDTIGAVSIREIEDEKL